MRTATATILLAAALALCAPSTAGADLIRLHATAASPPALAGGRTVVAVNSGHGYAVRSYDALGGSTLLAKIPRRYSELRLAASAQIVALVGDEISCDEGCKYQGPEIHVEDVLAVTPAGVRCIASYGFEGTKPGPGCAETACPEAINEALVSAGRLAWRACSSGKSTFPVLSAFAEPLTGARASKTAAIAFPESLAGEWLVGLAPGWAEASASAPARLIELNLATGAEPLSVALPPIGDTASTSNFSGGYPAFASVQTDGTVAWVAEVAGHGELYSASPAAPQPSDLGPWPADNTVSFLEAGPPLLLRDETLATRLGAGVGVQKLGGPQLATIATFAERGFDFDGTHLAILETPCGESYLRTWTVGEELPAAAPHGLHCPVPSIGRVSFGRAAAFVLLTCPAATPVGCPSGSVQVGGEQVPATFYSAMLAGTVRRVEAKLPHGWLKRHRHRRVEVQALNGEGSRTRRVRLR